SFFPLHANDSYRISDQFASDCKYVASSSVPLTRFCSDVYSFGSCLIPSRQGINTSPVAYLSAIFMAYWPHPLIMFTVLNNSPRLMSLIFFCMVLFKATGLLSTNLSISIVV